MPRTNPEVSQHLFPIVLEELEKALSKITLGPNYTSVDVRRVLDKQAREILKEKKLSGIPVVFYHDTLPPLQTENYDYHPEFTRRVGKDQKIIATIVTHFKSKYVPEGEESIDVLSFARSSGDSDQM